MNSGEHGRSKEDYLEAILVVIREKGACRSTDIAAQLHYSKPSVSVALHKLEDGGEGSLCRGAFDKRRQLSEDAGWTETGDRRTD